MQQLMDEAAHARLLFQYAKARFDLGVLELARGGPAGGLGSPCLELVRLGHLDFLAQELVTYPESAADLLTAEIDEAALREALAAVARQPRGPALLASLAEASSRDGLRVVEATRGQLAREQRLWLLAELRRHPSKRVRDRARRMLLLGEEGRLFPELTPREEEILVLLSEGKANQDIAGQLALTLATVKTHVHRIFTKTSARNRLAAAVLYRERAAASGDHPGDEVSGEGGQGVTSGG